MVGEVGEGVRVVVAGALLPADPLQDRSKGNASAAAEEKSLEVRAVVFLVAAYMLHYVIALKDASRHTEVECTFPTSAGTWARVLLSVKAERLPSDGRCDRVVAEFLQLKGKPEASGAGRPRVSRQFFRWWLRDSGETPDEPKPVVSTPGIAKGHSEKDQ